MINQFEAPTFAGAIPTNEGAVCELFRPTGNTLFIGLPSSYPEDFVICRNGNVQIKLHSDSETHALIIVVKFDFAGQGLTFDCPFDASLIGDIVLPEQGDTMQLSVIVVDTDENTLKGQRVFAIPTALKCELLAAVKAQRSSSYSSESAGNWISAQQRLFSANQLGKINATAFVLTE